MSDRDSPVRENISMRFYVDQDCTDCGLCRELALDMFRRNDKLEYSYVYNSPSTGDQYIRFNRAMEKCPQKSIGFDGIA